MLMIMTLQVFARFCNIFEFYFIAAYISRPIFYMYGRLYTRRALRKSTEISLVSVRLSVCLSVFLSV